MIRAGQVEGAAHLEDAAGGWGADTLVEIPEGVVGGNDGWEHLPQSMICKCVHVLEDPLGGFWGSEVVQK